MLQFCQFLIFLFAALSVKAGQLMLDINPDLGEFQDETECFPVVETWHQMYRDFEEDPYLGGKAKCVTGTETGDYEDGAAIVVFEFPPDEVLNTTITLMSSPGYTAKNILNVQSIDAPYMNENLTIAFRDCHSCKVVRHSYIEKGTGCSIWYTHKELHIDHPFCDFIFELLCGIKPTYQIYDDSCAPHKMKPKYGVETVE